MSALSLTLCGRVAAALDGGPLPAASLGNKSLALLAFLALEPGAHSRDEIMAMLWGEYPEEKARASLRQALAHLRDALGEALYTDRASVFLVSEPDSDIRRFLAAADSSPRDAADVDIPHFLRGLQLRRSAGFDEWADEKRHTLLRRYAGVLAAAVRESIASNRSRDAVRVAERWVTVDDFSADATLALMESQFLARNRSAALQAFADYRSRLDADERPDHRLVEMAQRIHDSRASGEAKRQATEEWYAAAPSFYGSLIGRDREWDRLRASWRAVAQSKSRVVIVEGESGVGKSRLADDFARWVTAEGGTVLRGRGFDARVGVPFGAMIEALRSGIDAPGLSGTDPQWLTEIVRVVPELRQRFAGLPAVGPASTADSWRLFEGIAQMLLAISEETPVTVLIDDVQWIDADSCALLHFLVRKLERAAILWFVTFALGAVERDSAAARWVRALRGSPACEVVALRPLNEDEVWQLVRGLGRVSTPAGAHRLASRIYEVTAGYPFYIVELLKTLFAQGWLTVEPESGEWIVRPSDSGDEPALTLPSVHEAIAERIECLSDELKGVLITIAVSTRGCRTDVMSHVHGISRLRAAAIGDALVERHLVVEDNGAYRVAHPVIGRVMGDELGKSRKREVHRGLALAMELVGSERAEYVDPGEIARHAEQAGERTMAYKFAMQAVESCERRFAFDDALAWLDFAAGVASTSTESDAVNRATAQLLEISVRRELPPARMTSANAAAELDVRTP
ncbi:MAG TPA: AAA family ATPase [Gemmatimonadaceae bacterium]|jgi:DNA-binding SARP family transcriptional activator|nr:AAA family ATPase [Gemmatimonadaceae bacterium]